jgi:predicted small lipoprotein YifL
MTRNLSFVTLLGIGVLLVSVAVTGCGVRGGLEPPPPKKEDKRDESALEIEEPHART